MYNNIQEISVADLKSQCTKIHYFGLGFIQVKLGDTYRLHFYTKDLPSIVGDEEIHNHRYAFTSKILKGGFHQKIFERIDGDTHTLRDESCGYGEIICKEPSLCSVRLLSTETYSTGSKYTLLENTFHTVEADDCITLLERDVVVKKYAQVISPVGAVAVCPFSRTVPEADLWEIIESMLQ
jgi:hypothetical protein